jgi:hypothetical protein
MPRLMAVVVTSKHVRRGGMRELQTAQRGSRRQHCRSECQEARAKLATALLVVARVESFTGRRVRWAAYLCWLMLLVKMRITTA